MRIDGPGARSLRRRLAMRPFRMTTRRMMILVAAVALALALGKAWSHRQDCLSVAARHDTEVSTSRSGLYFAEHQALQNEAEADSLRRRSAAEAREGDSTASGRSLAEA